MLAGGETQARVLRPKVCKQDKRKDNRNVKNKEKKQRPEKQGNKIMRERTGLATDCAGSNDVCEGVQASWKRKRTRTLHRITLVSWFLTSMRSLSAKNACVFPTTDLQLAHRVDLGHHGVRRKPDCSLYTLSPLRSSRVYLTTSASRHQG